MVKLTTPWILWYHSLNNKDWSQSSYKKIFTITDLYDFKLLEETIIPMHIQNSILFFMREDIFPTWEDPDNIEGCCISFKLTGSNIKNEFFNILKTCISENIMKDNNNYKLLNGISISPKKEFNILKIWRRDIITNYNDSMNEVLPFIKNNVSLIKVNKS
jgi:hypothetical protein